MDALTKRNPITNELIPSVIKFIDCTTKFVAGFVSPEARPTMTSLLLVIDINPEHSVKLKQTFDKLKAIEGTNIPENVLSLYNVTEFERAGAQEPGSPSSSD